MLDKYFKYKDHDGNNLLHLLVKKGDINLIQNILEKGLKYGFLKKMINNQNYKGNTPLHLAVKNKNNKIASILIDYGACKDIVNCKGNIIQNGGTSVIKGKRYL
tara:strand:+ start:399 stop:710 length:312 start_codon:yes stop_codon:yes gene_type:complete